MQKSGIVGKSYFKAFGDDREHEVLMHILKYDSEVTVPVILITPERFYSELYDQIEHETPEIILQKIKLLVRLHKIDVYHNDLGNGNFVIKDGVVKIIDFGSSYLTIDDEWLQALYENIFINDGVVISCKAEAFQFELTSFIESYD